MPSWKKIIVSGSNAELNQLTATSYGGNISGSSTSTGSFGHIKTPGGIDAVGPFTFQTTAAANDTIFRTAGTSGRPLTLKNSNDSANIDFQTNGDVANILMSNNSKNNLLKLSADGLTETRGQVGSAHADGNLELYSNNGLNNLILSASMTTISGSGDTTLDVKGNIFSEGNISGSSTSTGSFGKLLGDGSSLTGVSSDVVDDTSPQLGGNLDLNSNNITGTGNIDILGTITAQNFIVSSSVTSIEYQSISGSTIFGDTADDTHEFIGHVMMQSASFGMANHADRTNSNAANSYLFISQSVASKNGYVYQKAGNPGTNTFPFLLIDGANNQKASIRQDGRFSTPIVYLSNDNSAKLGEIDGDAGDSSAMYINANSRALQLSSEGKKTFKINTDGTTEIGGSGAYGVTNFGDLTVGGNLNLTSSAATLEVAGNISGSATSTGSFGHLQLANRDTDASFEFGRAHVGLIGYSDMAGFSHVDNDSTTNFALAQSNGGKTIINAKSGQPIAFKINNSDKVQISSAGNLGVGIETATEKLHVVGNSLITGDVTIGGDLTINGDTTTISTSNILVQDAFGFFATGSAGTNVDAGIIVQSGSFIDSGSALYHDISKERWSVGKGIASTATNVPDSNWGGFVATVYTASASPVGSSPKYGVGEIHVDDDGEIYIYS